MSEPVLRVLPFASFNAPFNMALDEALLAACETPILRLYSWQAPTISLGRFQYPDAALRETLEAFALESGFDIVRRATGGGAILHHNEL
ncbi:MAG: lipoate--protein ligase family protein, partial [Planctomycetes bacterium]|nr:lipoate--protein ligase family protein [Planctomycetota bacterium]